MAITSTYAGLTPMRPTLPSVAVRRLDGWPAALLTSWSGCYGNTPNNGLTITTSGMKTNSELLQIDVQELLPQRPPFVMIDRLVYNDETTTVTEFEVKADNLFAEGDLLNPCALVENIAQTCAVRMGYIDHYINKVHV